MYDVRHAVALCKRYCFACAYPSLYMCGVIAHARGYTVPGCARVIPLWNAVTLCLMQSVSPPSKYELPGFIGWYHVALAIFMRRIHMPIHDK